MFPFSIKSRLGYYILILSVASIHLISCQLSTKQTIASDKAINTASSTDSLPYYFPLAAFTDTTIFIGYDTFTNDWYSKHLLAMQEPILYKNQSDTKTYRFTWLRTFNYPIAIRLEKQKDECFLHWKVCNGAGGYEPGKLIKDKRKKIDPKFWELFEQRIDKLDFWNLETNYKTFGTDGAEWILEAKTKYQYHVVHRWSPDEEDQF